MNKTSYIATLTAIISTSFIAFPFVASALTSDVSNYWSFDEGGGRSAGDTGGQNGALYGTSTGLGWAGGKAGTALGMDGTPNTGVALPNGILSGSEGSLSVWFKLNSQSDQNIIFSARSTTDNNIFTALGVDYEGRPQLLFRTDPNSVNRKVQIGAVLNKNEWYHLVLVASGQMYKAYINGEEKVITGENIGRWFPDFTNQTLSYRIGASEANPLIGSFTGYIDELRIYKRALPMVDAVQLYNEGNAGVPAVPLALRPKLSFTISTDHVTYQGSATLEWSATLTDSCEASGGWSGAQPASGSKLISNIGSDAVYTLTCTGKGGPVSSSVRVYAGTPSQPAVTTGGTLTVTDMMKPVVTTPPSAGYQFTRNLTVGVRGDDVKMLQQMLEKEGFLLPGLPAGYFGEMTKQAVIKLQEKHGLPATGFFGAMTRAKLGSVTTETNTTVVTTTPVTPVDKNAQLMQMMNMISDLQKQLAALRAKAP